MHKTFCTLILFLMIATPVLSQELTAKQLDDRIVVMLGDTLITEYRYADSQKYPYFYPVNGPQSGESITTESSEPYPHHHSLFFGCDRVNGGNYWQDTLERGKIVPEFTTLLQSRGDEIVIDQRCNWQRPGAPSPFTDRRRIRIRAWGDNLRMIDFEITLTALEDVRIEKTNHSLFSARVVPELSVKQGGTLVNAQGDSGEKATFGKESNWMDYSGERNGVREGIAILNHPGNPLEKKWFTRDYGFFSPTPFNWMEKGFISISKGDSLHLRYAAVIHAGEADIDGIYNRWIENTSNEKR